MGKMDRDVERKFQELEKTLKSISKTLDDMEKRMKFVEERGKVLADSLTKGKDLEKLLEVHERKMMRDLQQEQKYGEDRLKAAERRLDIRDKLDQAIQRESEKEREQWARESQKYTDERMKEFEKQRLEARLTVLEGLVNGLQRAAR